MRVVEGFATYRVEISFWGYIGASETIEVLAPKGANEEELR